MIGSGTISKPHRGWNPDTALTSQLPVEEVSVMAFRDITETPTLFHKPRICPLCGNDLDAHKRVDAVYCSKKCMKKAGRPEPSEELRKKARDYYRKNKAECIERAAKWSDKNPEQRKLIALRYGRKLRELVRAGLRPEQQKKKISLRDPVKFRARGILRRAVKRGEMVRPDRCEQCGEQRKTQAHHDDYSKPLLVKWLCSVCHGRIHRTKYREDMPSLR